MGRNSSGNRGGGSTQAPIDTRGIAAYNQVKQMKEKYPDAVMLVRDGDVYRVFGKDTEALSAIGIKTSKISDGEGTTINEAGFPHQSLESVLPKLVRQGKRVAIMDAPIEQPKLAKRGSGKKYTPEMRKADIDRYDDLKKQLSTQKGAFNRANKTLKVSEGMVRIASTDKVRKEYDAKAARAYKNRESARDKIDQIQSEIDKITKRLRTGK